MSGARVEQVADVVLYEGYILYPYRPSSIKNRKRWNFGGLSPRAYSEAQGGSEPWQLQTECLAVVTGNAEINIRVRFLHLVSRQIMEFRPAADNQSEDSESNFHAVEALTVDGKCFQTWQEAVEREVAVTPACLGSGCDEPEPFVFHLPGSEITEVLNGQQGIAGAIVREQNSLDGKVDVRFTNLGDAFFRVRVTVSNTTLLRNADRLTRDEAMTHALVSTHLILTISGGRFISLLDPPEKLTGAAAACQNIGTYPVLAGEKGDDRTVLSSPVILYDYPQIAAESAGNLFDSTEIDEILTLRVMTLSDDEKREMCAADERARQMLERIESDPSHLGNLHGALRAVSHGPEGDPMKALELFEEAASLKSITIAGKTVQAGERILLRPNRSADIMDIALAGRVAVIDSIEQDYEGRVHLAVVIEDDPGRDLGALRQPGHRFFFSPEEVEILQSEAKQDGQIG